MPEPGPSYPGTELFVVVVLRGQSDGLLALLQRLMPTFIVLLCNSCLMSTFLCLVTSSHSIDSWVFKGPLILNKKDTNIYIHKEYSAGVSCSSRWLWTQVKGLFNTLSHFEVCLFVCLEI